LIAKARAAHVIQRGNGDEDELNFSVVQNLTCMFAGNNAAQA
jgi:hypothetical protein